MAYLQNCWYLAAWEQEVGRTGTLARRILDVPVVFYRDETGAVLALKDRCPHRFAPLSKGRIEKGVIFCGYHGLGFDGSGACVSNPHGPCGNLKVQSYPVREKHHGIWIWMGDPQRAETVEIPDMTIFDDVPSTAYSNGYLWGAANYMLFVDNILDLTHTDYLHPDTLGGGSYTRTKAKVTERERGMSLHWHCWNEVPQPIQKINGFSAERADSWTEIEWTPPSVMTLRNGAVPAGTPRENGKNFLVAHIMTPETEGTTHYFFAATRDFARDDPQMNARIAAGRVKIFSEEDMPMIEGQQNRMNGQEFWSLKPALLRSDEGAVKVRRKLDEMIRLEAEQQA
jgi:phenylpropionate dioxygenase-like ring-hydroxylating dioxygenase large terminal subunit